MSMRFRPWRVNVLLAIFTFIVVIYAEWFYPTKAFKTCQWPLGPTAKHVALIADPQLVDDHTYPGRNWLFMWFTRVVADRYMARNYRLLHRNMKPDAVFFLGDLFDGGREWDDAVWEAEYERWKQVFPIVENSYLNLPGNHDVGSAEEIILQRFERFKRRFGNPNQVRTIGDHSIVTLDTNALMNNQLDSVKGPAKEFFENLKEHQAEYDPIIVLTHVPLFRTEGSYCGFEREGKPLEWKKGDQYITQVGPEITQDILYGLKPALVFSGDDHDACKYTHRWALTETTEENTVKSFSMAMGIYRPGFQLLSVDTRSRHATESCLLAKPFYPIIFQAVTLGPLLIVLLLYSWLYPLKTRKHSQLPVAEIKKPMNATDTTYHLLSKAPIQWALSIFIAWVIGQFVINWWSYSFNL